MQTISKSKLKANMLELFRRLETEGGELIVTHRDKPVLRITPIKEGEDVNTVFAGLRGKVVYHGDLDEPTTEEWEPV